MSNDIHHKETYTHKNGKQYDVCWYYAYCMGSPLEDDEGLGVTERMDWNPTDEEQLEQHLLDYEPELEEETRLRLMRQLCRPSNRYDSGLYYDFMASMHKAQKEWGVAPDRLQEVVEADFKYIKGWYDDDWFWLTLGVAPIDDDGEVLDDEREYISGYESTILDNDKDNRTWKQECIDDVIAEVEHARRRRLHAGQLELELRQQPCVA